MKNIPGIAVVVLRNNKVILRKCQNCTPTTAFRLASLTKLFTAQGIFVLEKQGRLNVGNYAKQYIPDLPDYAKNITIKQLLTHKSGIPNHEAILYKKIKPGYEPTLNDVIPALKTKKRLLFRAGAKYQYSDTAYCLLAIIIENVSGKTYAQFLKQNIFKPLNMKNTVVLDETKPIIRNRAFGYRKFKELWQLYDYDQLNYIVGCEGVYSSINDLVKWSNNLRQNNIKEVMTQNKNLTYQTGWWVGFNNIVLINEKKGLILFLLSNSNLLRREKDKLDYAMNILKRF